jgi:hypothetical protein
MRAFYLIAAIIGFVVPVYFIGGAMAEHSYNGAAWFQQVLSERASLGLVLDLFISSFVFWPFMFREAKRHSTPSPWIFVVLNLFIGLSLALPLFLFFREKSAGGR